MPCHGLSACDRQAQRRRSLSVLEAPQLCSALTGKLAVSQERIMQAPAIPSLPDQLKLQPAVVWSGDAWTAVESADAWRASEVAVQINDHAKELLVYATQL